MGHASRVYSLCAFLALVGVLLSLGRAGILAIYGRDGETNWQDVAQSYWDLDSSRAYGTKSAVRNGCKSLVKNVMLGSRPEFLRLEGSFAAEEAWRALQEEVHGDRRNAGGGNSAATTGATATGSSASCSSTSTSTSSTGRRPKTAKSHHSIEELDDTDFPGSGESVAVEVPNTSNIPTESTSTGTSTGTPAPQSFLHSSPVAPRTSSTERPTTATATTVTTTANPSTSTIPQATRTSSSQTPSLSVPNSDVRVAISGPGTVNGFLILGNPSISGYVNYNVAEKPQESQSEPKK